MVAEIQRAILTGEELPCEPYQRNKAECTLHNKLMNTCSEEYTSMWKICTPSYQDSLATSVLN